MNNLEIQMELRKELALEVLFYLHLIKNFPNY